MAISFEQVVARIMANWPALQIAVDNSLGGELSREKAKWLVEVTSEFITGTDCGMFHGSFSIIVAKSVSVLTLI